MKAQRKTEFNFVLISSINTDSKKMNLDRDIKRSNKKQRRKKSVVDSTYGIFKADKELAKFIAEDKNIEYEL